METRPTNRPARVVNDLARTDDDTLAVRLFEAIPLDLADAVVKHYRTDLARDLITIERQVVPAVRSLQASGAGSARWWFSTDECGTYLSTDARIGLARTHCYCVRLDVTRRTYGAQDLTVWAMPLTAEQAERYRTNAQEGGWSGLTEMGR